MSTDIECLLTIIRHRERVCDELARLSYELQRRARVHDRDKLEPQKFHGFAQINQTARTHAYGTPEYRESLRHAGPVIASHYAVARHHPEYHAAESDMGWVDIIEMVINWKAAADIYGKMTLRDGLPKHRERFAFTDAQWWLIEQVVDWLEPENTA